MATSRCHVPVLLLGLLGEPISFRDLVVDLTFRTPTDDEPGR